MAYTIGEVARMMNIAPSTLRYSSEEQNRQKEQPTNKGNGNQKSLGHLKGAKTIAR